MIHSTAYFVNSPPKLFDVEVLGSQNSRLACIRSTCCVLSTMECARLMVPFCRAEVSAVYSRLIFLSIPMPAKRPRSSFPTSDYGISTRMSEDVPGNHWRSLIHPFVLQGDISMTFEENHHVPSRTITYRAPPTPVCIFGSLRSAKTWPSCFVARLVI